MAQVRPVFSQAMSVEPEPPKKSTTSSPAAAQNGPLAQCDRLRRCVPACVVSFCCVCDRETPHIGHYVVLVAVVVCVVEEGAQLHRFCFHALVCLGPLVAQFHHLIVWKAEGSALKRLLELFVVPLRDRRELRFAKPVPPHLNAGDLRELLGLESDLLEPLRPYNRGSPRMRR